MVLPVGLLSKHRSRIQIQRTSLEICVLAQAVGCIADPSKGGYDVAVAGELTLQIFLPPDLFQRLPQQTHFLFFLCI